MLFFLLSTVFPSARSRTRAAATLVASYLVELSQLYQADWINSLRQHALGHLALGSSFSWVDIAAYTVGIAVAAFIDILLRRPNLRRPHRSTA